MNPPKFPPKLAGPHCNSAGLAAMVNAAPDFMVENQPGRTRSIQFCARYRHVVRGAQPAAAGYAACKRWRRDDREFPRRCTGGEKRDVESHGMKYVSIRGAGMTSPSNAQVVQFLDLVRNNPGAKIFCCTGKRGADPRRDGGRLPHRRATQVGGGKPWPEMNQFHYDHFWLPQLQRYVTRCRIVATITVFQRLCRTPVFCGHRCRRPPRRGDCSGSGSGAVTKINLIGRHRRRPP